MSLPPLPKDTIVPMFIYGWELQLQMFDITYPKPSQVSIIYVPWRRGAGTEMLIFANILKTPLLRPDELHTKVPLYSDIEIAECKGYAERFISIQNYQNMGAPRLMTIPVPATMANALLGGGGGSR